MSMVEQLHNAAMLFRDGRSDTDVERLTGLSQLELLALRAEAASAPMSARPPSAKPERR